jgi:hypothetical protein
MLQPKPCHRLPSPALLIRRMRNPAPSMAGQVPLASCQPCHWLLVQHIGQGCYQPIERRKVA